ncbi:MAG: hypothetical protein O6945_00880 [Gammaproteobacteria bacterium]|nr:hypothetical protein [Gammaproteobacteria bacterium]
MSVHGSNARPSEATQDEKTGERILRVESTGKIAGLADIEKAYVDLLYAFGAQ